MKVEIEWKDGCIVVYSAADASDAWALVRLADPVGDEILSAWRDDEPWFGLCTEMQEHQP